MQKVEHIVSPRFTEESKDILPDITPEQRRHIDVVKVKILESFRLVENECPCRQRTNSADVVIAKSDRYGLPLQSVICSACGTIRIDPYLDEASLTDFYTNDYQDMYGRSAEVSSYFQRQHAYGKKFYSLAHPFLSSGSNVLEFGCGAGGALKVFHDHGHNVYGVEYSTPLIEYGRSQGLKDLYYGSLDEFKKQHDDVRFDFIFSNHVFEHIATPHAYLKTCLDMLKPGGCIVCAVPDIYHIDQYIFPNSNLKLMLHIAHIYNYSFACLESIARSLSMRVERLFPDPAMVTPTSAMPEIWFKMERSNGAAIATTVDGGNFVGYFQRTEENFLKGINLLKEKISLKQQVKNQLKKIIRWKK